MKKNIIKGRQTTAVRLYGSKDMRMDTFMLPQIAEDEILAKIICDSLCVSTRKASIQGTAHARVPDNIGEVPVILGHEFCGEIVEPGARWAKKFLPGMKFTIQPSLPYKNSLKAPGYSFPYIGGNATYVVIPAEIIVMDCLIPFSGQSYFQGALAEPLSCVAGASKAFYHIPYGSYKHSMGIQAGGNFALLAGSGPMGQVAIEYLLNASRRPGLLVVSSTSKQKIHYLKERYSPARAKRQGIRLVYILDTESRSAERLKAGSSALLKELLTVSRGKKYDDVLLMHASRFLVEVGDSILNRDGCLNFFAGPGNTDFSANINFYNLHYRFTHFVATSGGTIDDMKDVLSMIEEGRIEVAHLITHVGGLDVAIDTTLKLPELSGGKKIIYTHKRLPLVELAQLEEKGRKNNEHAALYAELHTRIQAGGGIWNHEAEQYLLAHAPTI